jgi:hypothetical protein
MRPVEFLFPAVVACIIAAMYAGELLALRSQLRCSRIATFGR